MPMIYRRTFRLFDHGERELVYEDILNENGQVISFKEHRPPDHTEGYYEYDANGYLVCEKELSDGEEGSRTEYQYDADGNITNTKLYVAGELFEELFCEYLDMAQVRSTVRYGEEVERVVESKDGDTFTREIFEGTELVQKENGNYDPQTRIRTIEARDNEGHLLTTEYQQFDATNNLLKNEVRDGNGDLETLSEYQYESGNVIFEKHSDYVNNEHFEVHSEYDHNDNMVSSETRTPSGKLLEYQKQTFDDQNRLVSDSGYSLGSFNAVYGTQVNSEKYVFEHEYEEK